MFKHSMIISDFLKIINQLEGGFLKEL